MTHTASHIIIDALIESPDTTTDEKADCAIIRDRIEHNGSCSFGDAWRICRIVWRLLRG